MAPRASFAFLVLPAALSGCHYAGEATSACYVQPPDGTNQSALYRVSGGGTCGTGGTSITSFAVPEGTFAATIRFRVRGALPNRAYIATTTVDMTESAATAAIGSIYTTAIANISVGR